MIFTTDRVLRNSLFSGASAIPQTTVWIKRKSPQRDDKKPLMVFLIFLLDFFAPRRPRHASACFPLAETLTLQVYA
jgi:hypothetical protein